MRVDSEEEGGAVARHIIRANRYVIRAKWKQARTAFSRAAKLDPVNVACLLGRSFMNLVLRDFRAALRDAATVLRLRPGEAWAYHVQAAVHQAGAFSLGSKPSSSLGPGRIASGSPCGERSGFARFSQHSLLSGTSPEHSY
eukprot:Protomagalhaensia_sp_Gyna_25__1646@NODE_1853_length_1470_cov_6_303284_g1522_i0_p1_GENE_NODE_1853_length_1470_cov_6_303284_g1522_i0NODE_1853_length_1470_cov_6_303284_g1522_i0_p1_ORF_typecomplete_len141_score4_22TPR_16/PF13432_6/0_032TPR_16/PF13432_6/0_48TPR_9/PF13371_6/0_00052TPR_19/PF14559_6/0_0068TPR_11/PF13414_6/0_081TPR_11/PF13414_6/2e02TPR_15/PF13429_6/0_028TPR_2/PF07719_17/0_21TPR_2/PF07719_17/8_2e02DUF2752/PF10825_8/5_2DUF2752/PF10825_8/11_NODE_1853_length_1470_cov_6_303284_g1522_i082504